MRIRLLQALIYTDPQYYSVCYVLLHRADAGEHHRANRADRDLRETKSREDAARLEDAESD